MKKNKNIKRDLDYHENNIKKDNKIEFENMRKNIDEAKPFYNRNIKQLFSDLKGNLKLPISLILFPIAIFVP